MIHAQGRLGNAASIKDSQRHPIILEKSHLLTIFLRFIHIDNFHAGNSLMQRIIIENYWVPGIKKQIQKCIAQCPTCTRWKAKSIQPEMSQLPKERVEQSLPFFNVGVDLCGPFSIKASPLKFDRTIKVWIVAFVCLITKAVHLELTTSLSADNFLTALSRFSSRRGTPHLIWSERGTNFIGSNKILRDTWNKVTQDCKDRLAVREINWKFIPRHSPIFGGLWEAAVKSLKFFIKRMVTVKNLTYEEFTTLLCKIESLLNSRPLYSTALSPEDEPALTPFHFITQRSFHMSSIDGADSERVPLTKKWLLIRQIQQQFWDRFRTEYLSTLQKKSKWVDKQRNLKVGEIVLIKEPSTVPGDWKMGKICNIYPDPAGIIRKVDVITASGTQNLHAVNQLVPLLPEDETEVISANETLPQNMPRRGLRKRHNPTNMLTIALVLFLSITATTCLNIISLNPGAQIYQLRNVAVKSVDFDFAMETSINLKEDMTDINQHVQKFKDFCASLNTINNSEIYNHCTGMEGIMEEESKIIINGIVSLYNTTHIEQKQKRWAPIVGKVATMATTAFVTAGMAYQAYEMHNLQAEFQEVEQRVLKLSTLMLNVSDVRYETIDSGLQNMIDQQRKILMLGNINDYAIGIQAIIMGISTKHQNAANIRPINELHALVNKINEKIDIFAVPNVHPDILFAQPPVKRTLQSNIVIITFKVLLVRKTDYTEYVVTNVPSNNHNTLILGLPQLVNKIAIDNTNNTYFSTYNATEILPGVFDVPQFITTSTCLKAIFQNKNNTNTSCNNTFNVVYEDKFLRLSDNIAVVIKTNDSKLKITIQCENLTETITMKAAIINFPNCSINNEFIATMSTQIKTETEGSFHINDQLTPVELKQIVFTENPLTLKKELSEELGHTVTPSTSFERWIIITSIGVSAGLIILIIISCVCIYVIKKHDSNKETFLSKEDKRIGSWVEKWIENQ